jgi:hypothetical protein
MELERTIRILCDAGVEFVVIGGVAGVLHGSASVTFDLDICYSRSDANLRRIAQTLAPFHLRPRDFPEGLPFVWDEATIRNGSQFTLISDLGDIDLLAEVLGVGSYKDVKARSVVVEAYARRFPILDLRALIQAKRAAGRDKDLRSLPELESLLEVQGPEGQA